MRRLGRGVRGALLPALLLTILVGRDAAAAGVGNATWSPVAVSGVAVLAGYRVNRDSLYVFLHLRWDRAAVRGLRAYEAEGLRYTQEIDDLSGRLSATGFHVTDLPGAAYDRDDDDGDGRWEEAELTVTDAGAIRAGRTYLVGVQFSRWTERCEDPQEPECWEWNRRGGDLAVLSQLSAHFLGEWQAERWTDSYLELPYRRMTDPRRATS